MANVKVSELTEYDGVPAAGDMIPLLDVSDTTQAASGTLKRLPGDRVAATDGTAVNFTGGGTVALGGFTLTVPETMTAANNIDVVRFFVIPFNWPWVVESAPGTSTFAMPVTASTSYTSLLGSSLTSRMQAYINKTYMPTNATVKLRVRVAVNSASTGTIQIVNSSSVAVSGSEVTTTSTSYEWVTSGDIKANLTSGEERYNISAKNSVGGSVYTVIAAAMFVIEVP